MGTNSRAIHIEIIGTQSTSVCIRAFLTIHIYIGARDTAISACYQIISYNA